MFLAVRNPSQTHLMSFFHTTAKPSQESNTTNNDHTTQTRKQKEPSPMEAVVVMVTVLCKPNHGVRLTKHIRTQIFLSRSHSLSRVLWVNLWLKFLYGVWCVFFNRFEKQNTNLRKHLKKKNSMREIL